MTIKKYTCKNEWQDKRYGPGNRVHNPMAPGAGGKQSYRCAVCGKVKD